ncbi:plasmid replication initiator TrfA [Caballeronia sordidicola]
MQERNMERALADAQLPPWPDNMRGVPNGVLRSALFSATKRGTRRYIERETIASVKGVSIIYTGPRLDQSDLDVWEGVLQVARLVKLGDRVEFTQKGFLRLIERGGPNGNSIGKSDREWLRTVLARLQATAVEITQGPSAYVGSLIDECSRDDGNNGRCVVVLNPKMRVLFNRDSWTQIDWNIRRALIGHPLAQWLHGFYSTHAAPIPYKAETLRHLCGSESGESACTEPKRHKALLNWIALSLIPALRALENAYRDAGQPFSGKVGADGLVSISRFPSASQQRHLRARAEDRRAHLNAGDRLRHRGGIEQERGGQRQTQGGDRTNTTGG